VINAAAALVAAGVANNFREAAGLASFRDLLGSSERETCEAGGVYQRGLDSQLRFHLKKFQRFGGVD